MFFLETVVVVSVKALILKSTEAGSRTNHFAHERTVHQQIGASNTTVSYCFDVCDVDCFKALIFCESWSI